MDFDAKYLLLYWWCTNKEPCLEEDTKIFLKYLDDDEEQLLHLVMQGDLFGNGKKYILTGIRQGSLNYLIESLPEISENDEDYYNLKTQFLNKLRMDCLQIEEKEDCPVSISGMDWEQIVEDIKIVGRERRERK